MRLATVISNNPQFGQMYPMDVDGYLGPLQSNWLAAELRLRSYCAYETIPLFRQLIVERQSATNLCTERLDPIDADHIAIVKPVTTQSTSYRALRAAMEETRIPNTTIVTGRQVKAAVSNPVSAASLVTNTVSAIDRPPTSLQTSNAPNNNTDISAEAFSDLKLRFQSAGQTADRLYLCWKRIAGQDAKGLSLLQTDLQMAIDGISPSISAGDAAIRNRDATALQSAVKRLKEYNRILQNPNGRTGPC